MLQTLDPHQLRTSCTLSEWYEEIPKLAEELSAFVESRDWGQFHTPRNLLFGLLVEAGELGDVLQWFGDNKELELSPNQVDKLSQEVADVCIYLIRFMTVRNNVEIIRVATVG